MVSRDGTATSYSPASPVNPIITIMKYTITNRCNICALIFLLFSLAGKAGAQTLDEARTLAEDGNLDGAVAMLRTIVAQEPKETEAALMLGDLLWNSGKDSEAIDVLESVRKRGHRDATLQLARIALYRYDLDQARELLAAYRKSLRQGKRQVAEDLSGNLEEQIDKVEGMLDRVQNIEVIDSVDVDAEEFFRHYPISPAAGRLLGPEALPEDFPSDVQTMVHITESGGRMVWSAPDDDGNSRLYGTSALLGNEWETPRPLGEELAEGGDAAYPFLMPDGVTLYYANDGENSLGGYDIYLSRMGEDGFLQPANIGMPFNSPYNDYLLVIDEYTGAGWFATDRNRHPGKVTIYTFIPQDLRVNVDVDSPHLSSLARLDNIALTRKEGADYRAISKAISDGQAMGAASTPVPDFLFAMPGNRVYTSLADFRNPRAKAAMKEYLSKEKKFAGITSRLEELREAYRRGDRSQSALITELESRMDNARAELRSLRDNVIKLEQQ